jgi:hypothetical protein
MLNKNLNLFKLILQVDQAVHPSEPKPSMVWLDKIIALKS